MILKKKNLIFDLGGILLDIHPSLTFEAFAKLGVEESMLNETHSLANSAMLAFETGKISLAELVAYIATLLPPGVRSLPAGELEARVREAWCALIGDLPLYKWQRLSQLRASGHKVYLLSNTNEIHWAAISRNIAALEGRAVESYFDGVFLSYEMKLCKPSKDIFTRVLSEAGILACDTLFFDDSADNCAAAGSVGIEAVLVERNSRWGDFLLKD